MTPGTKAPRSELHKWRTRALWLLFGVMLLEGSALLLEWASPGSPHAGSQLWIEEDTPQALNPLDLPTGMRAPRPMSQSQLLGHTVSLDRWGFRTAAADMAQPEPGQVDVLVVGDSVAFGQGVRTQDTLGRQLARALTSRCSFQPVVKTYACPGWGLDDELVATEAALRRLSIKSVVWLLTLNDLVFDDTGASVTRRPLGSSRSAVVRWLHRVERGLRGHDPALDLAASATETVSQRLSPLTSALTRMRALCRGASVSCVIALAPYAPQVSQVAAERTAKEWGFEVARRARGRRTVQRLVCAAAREHGLPCVDLAEGFIGGSEDELFQLHPNGKIDYVHPSERGLAVLASGVAPVVPLDTSRCRR